MSSDTPLRLYKASTRIHSEVQAACRHLLSLREWGDPNPICDLDEYESYADAARKVHLSALSLDRILQPAVLNAFGDFWKTAAIEDSPWSNLHATLEHLQEVTLNLLAAIGADAIVSQYSMTIEEFPNVNMAVKNMEYAVDSVRRTRDLKPFLIQIARAMGETENLDDVLKSLLPPQVEQQGVTTLPSVPETSMEDLRASYSSTDKFDRDSLIYDLRIKGEKWPTVLTAIQAKWEPIEEAAARAAVKTFCAHIGVEVPEVAPGRPKGSKYPKSGS